MPKAKSISVPLFSLTSKQESTISLPEDVFGAKVNKTLIAQALRVYTANQKIFTGSTKTRGEVRGTTAKMYRQKGTGRARHGAETAPIFVGGGISMGPKPRKVRLDLPRKMRKAALISALSAKAESLQIIGLADLDKATGKTKQIVDLIVRIASDKENKKAKKSKRTLIITTDRMENFSRATRNVENVNILPFNMINAFHLMRHQIIAIDSGVIAKIGRTSDKEVAEGGKK